MLTSRFLIERLENAGVKHVFGVPGDYVLDTYKELWDNKKIEVINNTDEAHSGFAADAYARVNGIGCAVATYSVGASKMINAVQCAYAERSPLIIISGAPGTNERREPFLLHHMVRTFNSQKKMFDEITCASVVLDDPATAGFKIDQAFEALHHFKRPIYIELPRDVAKQSLTYDVFTQGTPSTEATDPENFQEAMQEVTDWLKVAKSPVILAGVELARYKFGDQLIRFAERNNIPVATTLLSKSVVNERHPLFAGIYASNSGEEATRQLVEESDLLLIFGDVKTDMTLCFRPARFKKRQVVWANVEGLHIRNHTYTNVQFTDFCKALFKLEAVTTERVLDMLPPQKESDAFEPKENTKITSERLFEAIDSILDQSMAICADIGDSLFGAGGLRVHHSNQFLGSAYYTSMGTAIPYALGVQTAQPNVRPIVIVGDGAFQMSCQELSTIVQRKLNPIVILLNNDGYTTERFLLDGDFNNIHRWEYHRFVDVIGGGKGVKVETETELDIALREAIDSKVLYMINVVLGRKDISHGLKRMTEGLSKRI